MYPTKKRSSIVQRKIQKGDTSIYQKARKKRKARLRAGNLAYSEREGEGFTRAVKRIRAERKGGRGSVYGSETPNIRHVKTEKRKSTLGVASIWE